MITGPLDDFTGPPVLFAASLVAFDTHGNNVPSREACEDVPVMMRDGHAKSVSVSLTEFPQLHNS